LGATAASIARCGPGSGDFFVDGVQIEPLGDWTTYIDGTQEGCEWNGVEHGSTSSRSGEYIGGGTPQDLYQEYKFFVTKIVGAGSATQTLGIDSYALLPGGEMNSIKTESRQFSLIGKFITDTETELHDSRQDLIEVLKLTSPGQPLKLRFNGGRVQKEISVFYQGGLEGDLAEFYEGLEPIEDNQWGETSQYVEKASIQFNAPDKVANSSEVISAKPSRVREASAPPITAELCAFSCSVIPSKARCKSPTISFISRILPALSKILIPRSLIRPAASSVGLANLCKRVLSEVPASEPLVKLLAVAAIIVFVGFSFKGGGMKVSVGTSKLCHSRVSMVSLKINTG